jgi:hypothetical protein
MENTMRPKVFVDRNDAVKALHEMMNEVHERTKNLDHDELDKMINQAIAEIRQTISNKAHIVEIKGNL